MVKPNALHVATQTGAARFALAVRRFLVLERRPAA